MSLVKDFWNSDRLRKVLIWIGVAIILVSLPTIVWQQYHYNEVSNRHHDETVTLLNEHTDTLAEVKSLRTEVTKLVSQYGPALTEGQKTIVAEYTWIACALANGPNKCGPVPAS